MSERAEQLKAIWNELSPDEKDELLAYFNEGQDLADVSEDEWENDWEPELQRRLESYRRGDSMGMSGDEFLKAMKEKYG